MEITRYIPHRDSLQLIDRILNQHKDNFEVEVAITSDSLFSETHGVPAYCGLEYMAQSIAAFNTLHFSEQNEVRLGFIVAIRNFETTCEFFPLGAKLKVKVNPILIVEQSGSFESQIWHNDELVCKGRITAYVPKENEIEQLKQYK